MFRRRRSPSREDASRILTDLNEVKLGELKVTRGIEEM
jgi:hypothetical protein